MAYTSRKREDELSPVESRPVRRVNLRHMKERQTMISVPADFATATMTREGDAGRTWIQALPVLVEKLCQHWNLRIDGSVMHGYLGLVIPVCRFGLPCVLKVSWADDATSQEAMALSAWDGRGAVRLLDYLPDLGAMLLERLDHRRSLRDVGIAEAVEVAGSLLRRLAIPAPSGFRSLRSVSQSLCTTLPERWEQSGHPMPKLWMEQACELAAQLGTEGANLLVNYDLHYADVLKGERESWLVVDPKVVTGNLEFGIAQLLWTRLEDIEAEGGLDCHFPLLVEAAECDPALARSWTLVRCVDYWLWAISIGLTYDPARCGTIVSWLSSRS
jgi:streptomycin 6-kinase